MLGQRTARHPSQHPQLLEHRPRLRLKGSAGAVAAFKRRAATRHLSSFMKNILPVVCSLCAVTAQAGNGCDLDCSLNGMLQQERLTCVVYSLVQGEETRSGAVGFANF